MACTGLVATIPYIALQVYGVEISIARTGLPVDASLWIAFALLALVTYVSGLRSATLIAIVKDIFIWVTVIVAVSTSRSAWAATRTPSRPCRGRS